MDTHLRNAGYAARHGVRTQRRGTVARTNETFGSNEMTFKSLGIACISLFVVALGCGSHSGNSESEHTNAESKDDEEQTVGTPQAFTEEELGELPEEKWEDVPTDGPELPARAEATVTALEPFQREVEPEAPSELSYEAQDEAYNAETDEALESTYVAGEP